MADRSPSATELQELKHDAVPGFRRLFAIAIAVAGLYLAIILISSPGSAKGHHGKQTSEAKH